MKVSSVLRIGIEKLKKYQVEDMILKARSLLEFELQIPKATLSLHLEDEVLNENEENFYQNIQKLIHGIPMQYITNYQCFYGLDFYVDSDVLIPQPDTEILVEEVIQLVQNMKPNITILDMCTGSGAIAISIAKHTKTKVKAADINENALKIACKNATLNEVRCDFFQSDMFQNVSEKFDIIVSNPPYIETKKLQDLSQEVKNEPRIALDGGEDGLEFYRILAQDAPKYLTKGGFLAVEIGFNQREKVEKILKDSGFCEIYSKKDFGANDRIVVRKMEEIKCHFHLK